MQPTSYLAKILASGPDAESFLQGQLTQDVRKLVLGTPLPAGYCSPKGRLLAVMQLERMADGITLELHRSVLEATLKRLKMFVLRSKVTLSEVPAGATLDETAWRHAQILAGVPVVYPATSDHFVPQMVNLDQLGGISFDKGCYTGQEIVARLHYLGNLKKRMFLLHSEGPPPAPGSELFEAGGDGQSVGSVVDAAAEGAGSLCSAVLQLGHAHSIALRLGSPDGPALNVPQAYSY